MNIFLQNLSNISRCIIRVTCKYCAVQKNFLSSLSQYVEMSRGCCLKKLPARNIVKADGKLRPSVYCISYKVPCKKSLAKNAYNTSRSRDRYDNFNRAYTRGPFTTTSQMCPVLRSYFDLIRMDTLDKCSAHV